MIEPVSTSITIKLLTTLCSNFLNISGEFLKEKFIEHVIKNNFIEDKDTIKEIAEKLEELKLNDEMNEKAIERRINSSDSLVALLETKQPKINQNITQNNINGDNNIEFTNH